MTLREMSLVKQCQTREHLEKVARVYPPTIADSLLNVRSHHPFLVSSTLINALSIYLYDSAAARSPCRPYTYYTLNADWGLKSFLSVQNAFDARREIATISRRGNKEWKKSSVKEEKKVPRRRRRKQPGWA